MIDVVIADDQELVRTGFHLILDLEPGMRVVGEAADGEECLALVAGSDPDVVLMDIRMPNVDGIRATERLMAAGSRARVLVLTTFGDDEYVYACLRAGASGFLLKDAPREQLVAAIRAVARGESALAPAVTRRLIERFIDAERPNVEGAARVASLSPRESEVLAWIARGASNAEIAGRLFVTEATVKTFVGRLLAKLGVRDRLQAVIMAYESGFVRPGHGAGPSPASQPMPPKPPS